MIYLKSVLVGIGAAIATAVLWILATFVLPLFLPFLMSRATGAGAGGVGVAISSGSILAAALVGFVAGFWWKFRRVSKPE